MTLDVLAKNILKRIKEPAIILNVKNGEVIIAALNQAYISLISLGEEQLLGKLFFSNIAIGDYDDMRNIEESLNRLTNENTEEQIDLKNFFFKNASKDCQIRSVEVSNTLLSTDQSNGSYILQTLNLLLAPIPKYSSKHIKLSKILESSPDVICTLDERGRFLSVNIASQRMWGYTPEQLIGKYLSEFLHPQDRKAMMETLSLVMKGADISHCENRLLRPNGSFVSLVWSARWDAVQRIVYCVSKGETEKQSAQDKLKISEQRFKTLVQDGSDLIAILNTDGKYLYVSPTSQSVLGTPPEEYLGKNAFDFIHPDDKAAVIGGFEQVSIEQRVELAPFRFLHKDGSWRWVETVITDLTNDPAVNGIVANSRDITEKVNIQQDIMLSNERYRFVSMATSDAIWDWDIVIDKVYWEGSFRRIFQWQPNELNFDINSLENLVHPEDRPRVQKKMSLFLESSESQWSDEYRLAKADGTFAVVANKGIAIRDDSGKAIRVVGAMQDVTVQRNKEYQLRLFGLVVTQTSELVMITEAESVTNDGRKIVYVNEAFCKLTGYASDELIGKTPHIFHGESTNRKEVIRLRKTLKKLESCEVNLINYKKNGEQFWNNFTANPIANEKGQFTHCISIGRDLSNVIDLQKQERLMSSISEIFNTTDGLFDAMEQTTTLLASWNKYDYSEIWMLEHDGVHLELMSKHTLAYEQEQYKQGIKQITKVVKTQGFSGEVWDVGRILFRINSGEDVSCFTERGLSETLIKSLFGIPLFHNKDLMGVLIIGSQDIEMQTDFGVLSEKFSAHLAAEIQRKQLEQELGQIFDFVPEIIAISDFDGYFKKLNPAASSLLGYTTDELLSKPFTDFLHPDDKKKAIKRLKSSDLNRSIHLIEERYITKGGDVKWLSWTSHAEVDRRLIFSVAKDITEKKNLEGLLARSTSLAKVGSWEINVLKETVYWSDVTKEIREVDLDYEPNLQTGMGYFRSKADRETIKKNVDECIAYGSPWDEELEILTFKGNPKWIRTIGQAEMLEGKCIRIFGSFQDVDQRKRAEIDAKVALKKLKKSEKRYSDLFHLSPNPMWVYNCETLQFMDANETALSHYGYSYEEFMNMTLHDIRSKEEIPGLEEITNVLKEEGCKSYFVGVKHQKKNGEVMDVEVKSNVIKFKGQKAAIVLINDITERQRDFNTLQKQNQILKEISWVQSHVVRAPLSKIMGLVDLLGKHSMKDFDKQKILIKNIEHCTAELDEIIRAITKKSEQQARLSKF